MKVLIIHHLEPIWERGYKEQGTDFFNLANDFVDHLENNDYDKVILTQFENFSAQDEHYESGIAYHVNNWYDYAYGWERESVEWEGSPLVDGIDYCKGGYHSDIVLIDDWMKELKNDEVFISGAFDGECIEDLEIALAHININFKRIENLIL